MNPKPNPKPNSNPNPDPNPNASPNSSPSPSPSPSPNPNPNPNLRVLLPARERLSHALAGHGHQLGEHGGAALHPWLRLPVLNDPDRRPSGPRRARRLRLPALNDPD